jgi:hypothetical protein
MEIAMRDGVPACLNDASKWDGEDFLDAALADEVAKR